MNAQGFVTMFVEDLRDGHPKEFGSLKASGRLDQVAAEAAERAYPRYRWALREARLQHPWSQKGWHLHAIHERYIGDVAMWEAREEMWGPPDRGTALAEESKADASAPDDWLPGTPPR